MQRYQTTKMDANINPVDPIYLLTPENRFYDEAFEEIKNNGHFIGVKHKYLNNIVKARFVLSDANHNHRKIKKDIENSYIREHNIAVAFFRTHGYPNLQTINKSLQFDPIPGSPFLARSNQVISHRISCITQTPVDDCDLHFFRISRRVTIADFCFDMAMFALNSNQTIIKDNSKTHILELYVAFPNIMKNGIKSCTKVISTDPQFKRHFTDEEFDIWQQRCIARKIEILAGNTKLRQIFFQCYCPDATCNGCHGFVLHSNKLYGPYRGKNGIVSGTVARCDSCSKQICIKCFKWEHGKFACDATQDEMTAQIIKETTKKCPSCSLSTEKSDGCNHITCRCGTHWCWGCNVILEASDPYRHNGTVCTGHLPTDMNVWRDLDIPLLV